jgi:hypothetical protein
LNSRFTSKTNKGYSNVELYIDKTNKTDLEIRQSLESRIAKMLVGCCFTNFPSIKKRNSIFNSLVESSNEDIPLSDEDQAIIKEVYKKGFEERLAKAENQFKDSVLRKIDDAKIASRDRSLWWVRNPIAVIFLPALIFVLLSLLVTHKIYQLVRVKTKKDWLQFGIVSIVALLLADIIIVFCISFYDLLTMPDDSRIYKMSHFYQPLYYW